MADEGVPWMIGGGVRHPVEVARLLAYVAFGGSEGIVGPTDLQVRALATPGGSVRIAPGAAAIINKGSGMKYDAYACRWPIEETLAIAGTGGAARTDMVIARVENPYQAGESWPTPSSTDLANGTAVFRRFAVVTGVSPTAKTLADVGLGGQSAIPLARITLPANTTAVQQSHITDLRRLSQAQRADSLTVYSPTTAETLTSGTMVDWHSAATVNLDVPTWATHVTLRSIIGGIQFGASGNNNGAGWGAVGALQMRLGTAVGQPTNYNVSVDTGKDLTTLMAGAPMLAIPASMRGTTQVLAVQGRKASGSTSLVAGPSSMFSLEAAFTQLPESN